MNQESSHRLANAAESSSIDEEVPLALIAIDCLNEVHYILADTLILALSFKGGHLNGSKNKLSIDERSLIGMWAAPMSNLCCADRRQKAQL